MLLNDEELLRALTEVRQPEVDQIAEMMRTQGFSGISGEALSGKTTLVAHAGIALSAAERAAVAVVDLDGAYSIPMLVARWRHQLLNALIGPRVLSTLTTSPREVWSIEAERAALDGRAFFGDKFESTLYEQPKRNEGPDAYAEVIAETVQLARGHDRPLVLVFDHLQAPELTTRNPIDPRDLLWKVRAAAQHERGLHVAVVCAEGSEDLAADPNGAFHGDGSWLRLPYPTSLQWQDAAHLAGGQIPSDVLRLSRGHGPTLRAMLRAQAQGLLNVSEAFKLIAETQVEHAHRCLKHAASLHRIAPPVLVSIANGERPYAAAPDARSDAIAAAVAALRRAGMIRRDPKDPRGWLLVDPCVRWVLADPPNLYADDPVPDMTFTPV